jgi:hypothetical protein
MHDLAEHDHPNDPLWKHGSDRIVDDARLFQHNRCNSSLDNNKRNIASIPTIEEGTVLAG